MRMTFLQCFGVTFFRLRFDKGTPVAKQFVAARAAVRELNIDDPDMRITPDVADMIEHARMRFKELTEA